MDETKQKGLMKKGRYYYTQNLTPGVSFFEEGAGKLRRVDPNRSKFVAAIAKGLHRTGIKEGAVMLYLGASHGYTPSFMSDLVGPEGMVFSLDFAPRVVRDLYFVCEKRQNMAPLLADAKKPESFKSLVPKVDVVFQDIAQREQVGIFIKNCDEFLKPGGYGLLAVKARSIDVTAKPSVLFKKLRKQFEEMSNYSVVDYRELAPFEKDHAFFVVKKK